MPPHFRHLRGCSGPMSRMSLPGLVLRSEAPRGRNRTSLGEIPPAWRRTRPFTDVRLPRYAGPGREVNRDRPIIRSGAPASLWRHRPGARRSAPGCCQRRRRPGPDRGSRAPSGHRRARLICAGARAAVPGLHGALLIRTVGRRREIKREDEGKQDRMIQRG